MSTRFLELREELPYNKNNIHKKDCLKYVTDCIENANNGFPEYYKCHLDFIHRLDPVVLGDFPKNIDMIYWFHNGYEGSIIPNSIPSTPKYEIFIILKLRTYAYISIHFKQGDLSLNAVASSHYDKLIENLSNDAYKKYIEETQLLQRTPVFCSKDLSPIKSAKAYTPLSNTPEGIKNIILDANNFTLWDSMKDMSPIDLGKISKKTTFQDLDEKIDLQNAELNGNEDEYNDINEDDNSSTETSYSEELRSSNWNGDS